jgi:hypothetical protein
MKRFLLAVILVFTVAVSAHAKVTKGGTPVKNHKSPIVIHPLNSASTTTSASNTIQAQPDFGSKGGFRSLQSGSIHK